MRRVCIVGISGKLGQYMTEHALARGYEVVGVCRAESVAKLARFGARITVRPAAQTTATCWRGRSLAATVC